MTRTDYAERYARMIDAAITLIDEQAAFWCTAQRYDAVTDEFFDAACTHCDLLAILEQEPPCMTTTTALTLWSALAAHSVPREYRGAASMAAMEFFDSCAAGQDEAAAEWKRQRSAALPHVHGEGPLANRCLTCGDPYPCDGYIRDIDNGDIPC